MSSTSDKTAPESADDTCTVCGGTRAEHGPGMTFHAFTSLEGDLVTHAQQKKREQGPTQPMIVRLPQKDSSVSLNRLVEVLGTKNLITQRELMYITGISEGVEVRGISLGAGDGVGDRDDRSTETA